MRVRNTSQLIASSMQVGQQCLQKWFCLLQRRKWSHSIPQEDSESSLVVWIIYQQLPNQIITLLLSAQRAERLFNNNKLVAPQKNPFLSPLNLPFLKIADVSRDQLSQRTQSRFFSKKKNQGKESKTMYLIHFKGSFPFPCFPKIIQNHSMLNMFSKHKIVFLNMIEDW